MAYKIDLTGKTFNRLTVLRYYGKNKQNRSLWECKCECGNIKVIAGTALTRGDIKSCGCLAKETAAKIANQLIKRSC